MLSFFQTLEHYKDLAIQSNNVESILILTDLESLVNSGSFSSYSKASEFMALRNLPAKRVAEIVGIKPESVKAKRSELSKQAWTVFGYDFFTSLASGKYSECRAVISFVKESQDSKNLIPISLQDLIRASCTKADLAKLVESHNVQTFVKELEFLSLLSEPYLRARITNLEPWRLLYLVEVLNGKTGSFKDRVGVSNYLNKVAEGAL